MSTLFAFSCILTAVISSDEPECQQFRDIYDSGKELCENMWDDSFVYTENTADAYTMWFFDDTNPNDQVSVALNKTNGTVDECYLDYYHRDVTAEADNFTECHPWANAACCYESTVASVDNLLHAYGPEYRWDRCGELSQACERFFVQEACFYECSPHIGLYKVWNSTWKINGMPIKADYCDAWWRACANDYFCASDGGSYFSCALEYADADAAESDDDDDEASTVWIIIVIVIGVALLALAAFLCFIRIKEQDGGQAYFAKMVDENTTTTQQPTGDGASAGDGGNTEMPTTR